MALSLELAHKSGIYVYDHPVAREKIVNQEKLQIFSCVSTDTAQAMFGLMYVFMEKDMSNTIRSVAILVLAAFLAACGPSKDELAQAECLVLSATHPFDLAGRLERINDFRLQIGEPPYLEGKLPEETAPLYEELEFIVTGDICASVLLNDSSWEAVVADFHKKEEEARIASAKRKLVLSAWRFRESSAELNDSENLVIQTKIDNSSDYSDLHPPTLLVQLTNKYEDMIFEHVFVPNRDFTYDQESKRIDASLELQDTPLTAEGFHLFVCQPGEIEPQSGFDGFGQAEYLEDKDLTCAIYDWRD